VQADLADLGQSLALPACWHCIDQQARWHAAPALMCRLMQLHVPALDAYGTGAPLLPCALLHSGRAKLSHTIALPTFKAVEGVAVAVGIPKSQALHLDPEVEVLPAIFL
jgi:hypothetical protein